MSNDSTAVWGPYGRECGAAEPGAGPGSAAGCHQGQAGGTPDEPRRSRPRWLSLQVVFFKSSRVYMPVAFDTLSTLLSYFRRYYA
jgi:hypothetical protein